MMNAAIRVGDGEKALKYFNELKVRELEVDSVKYEMVLAALALGGKWEKSLEIKSEMEGKKIAIGPRMFSSIIEALLHGGQPELALKVQEEGKLMHRSNPLLQTALMGIWCHKRNAEGALAVFNE